MSHYFQLLGSDTPNGYGGCCYYGPLDHPAFLESPTVPLLNPGLAGLKCSHGASLRIVTSAMAAAHAVDGASPVPLASCVGEDSPLNKSAFHPSSFEKNRLLQRSTENEVITEEFRGDGAPSVAATEAAASHAWNSSSDLHPSRPTWPTSGPLHLSSLFHPTPSSGAHPLPPSSPAGATALHITADTGSSGNEGYIFFNCPEGTQRFSSEANIKLKKVRCFCFTRWNSGARDTCVTTSQKPGGTCKEEVAEETSLSAVGRQKRSAVGAASAAMGLPGMLFTINDAGSRQATFFGPGVGLDPPHNFTSRTAATGALGKSAGTFELSRSEGLRGFLTALRFHYFRFRPMVFRQLHGVAAYHKSAVLADKALFTNAAKAKAATLGNEIQFTEIADSGLDDVDAHGLKASFPETFFYATIPLSSQSLLVAFRVSGTTSPRARKSIRDATEAQGHSVKCSAATCNPQISLSQAKRSPRMEKQASQESNVQCPHSTAYASQAFFPLWEETSITQYCGCDGEQRSSKAANGNKTGSYYALPDSSDVVLGYAIIVSPGATFDVTKARALGVRSGPKYGLLKQGIPVEADTDADTGVGAKGLSKAAKTTLNKERKPISVNEPASEDSPATGHTTTTTPTAEVDASPHTPASPSTARWIHPYQVMRATAATKHAYVSLVLDGDSPQDVRLALEHLFGCCRGTGRKKNTNKGNVGAGEADKEGALWRLLRSKFPHLAFYYDDTIPESNGGSEEDGSALDPFSQQERLRFQRRPRHLTVRHVAHVQPLSYFDSFHAGQGGGMAKHNVSWGVQHPEQNQQQQGDRSGDTSEPQTNQLKSPSLQTVAESVYANYNAYIFANVVPLDSNSGGRHHSDEGVTAKLQMGLVPSLSFTSHDLVDEDENDEGGLENVLATELRTAAAAAAAEKTATNESPILNGSVRTWHLFTSYVQRHFTAFPTALVHRYHLHHLAPTLFPLRGADAHALMTAESTADTDELLNADSFQLEQATEYWPYSLKLRCIPEAALHLRAKKQSKQRSAQPHVAEAAAKFATATSQLQPASGKESEKQERLSAGVLSASSPSTPSPPLKREKREESENGTSGLPTVGAYSPTCTSPPSASRSVTKANRANSCSKAVTSPTLASAPAHLAVVDGQASLLPYPTPASALALLSDTFLTSLKRLSATEQKVATHSTAVSSEESTVPFLDLQNSKASRAAGALADGSSEKLNVGKCGGSGGALGFLGTGSAVPSKYRNVSGAYLELFLPRYCFCDADTIEPTFMSALEQEGQKVSGKTANGSAASSWASAELRRGIIILDFGEGSLGQLVSLCEGVREGVCQAQSMHHRCADLNLQTADGRMGSEREGGYSVHAPHGTTITAPAPQNFNEAQCSAKEMNLNIEGGDRLRQFVLDIVLVFISHAHADHHLGLLSLLTLRHHYLSSQQSAQCGSRAPPLLIVCPAEVYQFLMDAWGSTEPYRSWLHEECVFELMPSPLRGMALTTAVSAELADDKERSNTETKETPRTIRIDNTSNNGAENTIVGEGPHGRCHYDDHHHSHSFHFNDAQVRQHVVPVPVLQAQLRRWNSCIWQHIKVQQQRRQQQLKQEEDVRASQVTDSKTNGGNSVEKVWWEAEVITVEHPANAHALLLRFPFCSVQQGAPVHSLSAAAEASKQHSVMQPETTRVFVFSGDTRPSQFLVERTRIFTARKNNKGAASANASTSPVFILLHEATFGPGFEGEAVRKKHSTLPEALAIGAAVHAEFIVLNHFSQRYPKLPGLSEEQLGGKSTDLVCQRRPRSTTTTPTTSAAPSTTVNVRERDTALIVDAEATVNDSGVFAHTVNKHSEETGAVEGAEERRSEAQEAKAKEEIGASDALTSGEPTTPQSPTTLYANMSFAFDLMSVSFYDMHRGLMSRLTPALVRLLEEYDSWGISTTHRMRTSCDGKKTTISNSDTQGKRKKVE